MIPPEVRLYTWLDVEDTILQGLARGAAWPDWFVDARAYWDEVVIRVRTGKAQAAVEWLQELFEPRIVNRPPDLFSQVGIALEALNGWQRTLPVAIEETDEIPAQVTTKPSLVRPVVIQPTAAGPPFPPPFPDRVSLFAFHSFKGGVGRTVHALALAHAITDRGGRALLVDADLEAPGITWLVESRLPSPPISFADVLALAHGEADPTYRNSISLAADRLRGANLDGIYLLPAFRSPRAFQSLDVRPEHLVQGNRDPFLLSTLLVSLGRELDVDAVIVDLRAGLSELSAGLVLDPRVNRVFVTTLAGQALNGTLLVLDLIAGRAPSAQENHPVPVVIVNEVPADKGAAATDSLSDERLLAAVARCVSKGTEEDLLAADVVRGPSWFDANLLALPPGWDEALALIRRSQLVETIRPMAELISRQKPQGVLQPPGIEAGRTRLEETAGRLIYAEAGAGDDFLPISPLRRLVQEHRAQVPVSLIVGAKGAGKTYTYLQLAVRERWREFAKAAGESEPGLDAWVCPVLEPRNLEPGLAARLQAGRASVPAMLELPPGMDADQVRDQVRTWLKAGFHEGKWRQAWLDLLAWTAGFSPGEHDAIRGLAELLSRKSCHVLFLFDGLEDLFQNIASSEAEQLALRSLLQEVPNWLEQQPIRSMGLLAFVRRDMVTAAVRQNAAQLMNRYDPYALKWDRVEALRLAAWVCQKSGLFPGLNVDKLRSLHQEELTEALFALWGRKLGGDKSREGRSAEWVLTALSDFRNQIQARDVVRFLHSAAKNSARDTQWSDRILIPAAIREAVSECSRKKIEEIEIESPALKTVFEKLRQLPDRSVPFQREDLRLEPDDLQLLEINGVITPEGNEYYMAEIFRRGLGFDLRSGARPRVLALARRRQG